MQFHSDFFNNKILDKTVLKYTIQYINLMIHFYFMQVFFT